MSIYSFILIFLDQTIMTQSGNGAASEGDVTSLGTGQELNFDDDTLKGNDSLQLLIVYYQKAFNMRNLMRNEIKDTEKKGHLITFNIWYIKTESH